MLLEVVFSVNSLEWNFGIKMVKSKMGNAGANRNTFECYNDYNFFKSGCTK